jgi:TRAP-type C4-dicarboxylate transport system permease small subunit
MGLLKCLDRMLLIALKALTITCFVIVTILVTANVLVRFFPVVSLHWFDEIIELFYAYLVFYGAAALWISRGHISVGDWIGGKIIKKETGRHLYRMALESVVLVFALIFFYYSLRLTVLARDVTNVFAIPKSVLYSCMPVAGVIMILYSIRNIAVEIIPLIHRKTKAGTPPP